MNRSGKLGAEIKCFRCGRKMDSYTGKDKGARPGNLDIGICLYCSAVFQYLIDDLTNPPHITIKEAPAEVIADNMADISRAQRVLKKMRGFDNG